jgi:hypothetical protein
MSNYPDWVLENKKKGTYINKVGDKYYLYAAHSERIKGTKKVRRVSDGYLGRITENEGLIPPKDKVNNSVITYEFGFSYAILCCTSKIHSGFRKSFVKNGDLIYVCSILHYIYGFYDDEIFKLSYLSFHFNDLSIDKSFTDAQIFGIERGTRMVTNAVLNHYGDDLPKISAYCSTVNLIRINKKLYRSEISKPLLALSTHYSIPWEDAKWPK